MDFQTEPSLSPPQTNSMPELASSPYQMEEQGSPERSSPEAEQALEAPASTQTSSSDYTGEVPSWATLDDVQLDAIPVQARPYAERLLGLARMHDQRQQDALATYQQSKEFFENMVQQLEAAGVQDARPMAQQLEAQTQTLNAYAGQMASVAWQAFEARNPTYARLPPTTKELFAKVLENPQFEQNWEGRTYVDKLEDALRFAMYRTNVQVAPAAATVQSSAMPLPPLQTQPRDTGVARRQAAVASGETGGGLPVRAINELSWDEVLGRHDHLLK